MRKYLTQGVFIRALSQNHDQSLHKLMYRIILLIKYDLPLKFDLVFNQTILKLNFSCFIDNFPLIHEEILDVFNEFVKLG